MFRNGATIRAVRRFSCHCSWRYILLLSGLIIVNTAFSQQKYFRFYTSREGLPSSTVPACPEAKTVFQDNDGFIWLATFGGVSIYDGYKFKNYSVENGNLSDDIVLSIFQRNKDETWVVESACIDVFVKRKRVSTFSVGGTLLSPFLLTQKGKILTGGYGAIYEIKNGKLETIVSFPHYVSRLQEAGNYFIVEDHFTDSLFVVDKDFKTTISRQKGRVIEDRFHRFWIFNKQPYLLDTAALQKGLFKLLPAPFPVNNIKLENRQVLDFLIDQDGFFWILLVGVKGVLQIDPEGHSRFFQISTNNFISLLEDREGNIWIPGDAGFYKYYNKYNDFYSETEGLPSEYLTGVVADEKEEGAWVANRNGFSCIYRNQVFNFPYYNGPSTWSNLFLHGDSLWVVNNGLFLYEISYQARPNVKLLKKWATPWRPDDFVDWISFSQQDGTIFLNKFSAGLFYVKADGTLKKLHDAGLTTFFIDGNELWTGGYKAGVARWKIIRNNDSVNLQLMQRYTQLPDDVIRSIAKDSAGNLWMGTVYKGILKFEKKQDSFIVFNYNARHGLMNPWVLKIFTNRKGEVFAGTMGGIFQVHTNMDPVFIEDLSARFGDVYTTWDLSQDAKGNFWLATPVGVVHVRNDILKKTSPPKVFFTQLLKNNKPDSSLFINAVKKFSYKENNLTFEFSSNSFRNESKVLYSYQLEKGKNASEWSIAQPIHTVSLVSLSPGSYKLRVKAMTSENLWSETPAEYRFIINSPFWSTWWFRLLVVAVIVAAVYLLYRFRIKQLKKVMAVRMKISRDLHDEIGSTLSGIGIISEMAKQQLESEKPAELKKSLEKISVNTGETLGKMSDIIWAINPLNDSFEEIISRLESYAKSIAIPLGIQVYIKATEEAKQVNLDMQKRNNIYLICKEAINNAIKYSGAGQLFFVIEKNNQHICIIVRDDGKGFDSNRQFGGNGLKNMEARAKEIKANLNITSENGSGTAVELSLNIT